MLVPRFATGVRLLVVALALVGCTTVYDRAGPKEPPEVQPSPTQAWTPPAAAYPHYGGADVRWPEPYTRAKPPPHAYGAVLTTGQAALTNGRALVAGLTLPIVEGPFSAPVVLTPCLTRVRLAGSSFEHIAPADEARKVVVLDPGHGGVDPGAVGPKGTPESIRNLQVAQLVQRALENKVAHVVLTRSSDMTTLLGFRTALADALRASLAVSVHFNTSADGRSNTPGASMWGSFADPNGRRAAGVMFETVRAYLDTLSSTVGDRWLSNRDAGALYRVGSRGDFYFLLREGHATWVLTESMYISNPVEEQLLAHAAVRKGLARAIADGAMRYLTTDAAGSGWRNPVDRGNPGSRGGPHCTDPYAA
jgi:N-acetylmuramoyl-L-alanine amidase